MVASLLHKKTQSTPSSSTTANNASDRQLLTQDSADSDALSPLASGRPVLWSHHNRLLICAPSNSAVDELLLRLTKGVLGPDGKTVRVKVVRMGEPLDACAHGIRELSLEYQTEEIVKRSTLWASYNRCAAAIQAVYGKLDSLSAKVSHLNSTKGTSEGVVVSSSSHHNTTNTSTSSFINPRNQHNDVMGGKKAPESEREQALRQIRQARFDLRQLRKEREEIFAGLDKLRAETRRDLIYEAQIVVSTLSGRLVLESI